MNTAIILTAVTVCLSACALFIYIKASRVLKKTEEMIDAAIDGKFSEREFSEERLSKTEAKLRRYISASEVMKRQTESERQNIRQLVADISHQTQTPLANIMMYTQLLAESENIGADERKLADRSSEQAEKLSFLIASLVKTSRLENGMISLNPRRGSVTGMLAEIYESFAAKAAAAHRYLILDAGEKRNEQSDTHANFAYFDRKWTIEAIGNIVDNAIKYTQEGGTISISLTEYELFVCVNVSDDGIGIDEAEQAQVFGRFYRSQAVADRQGVGIGLYLAREIISKEGGYIRLLSKKGEGSVFSVFLPKMEIADTESSDAKLSIL